MSNRSYCGTATGDVCTESLGLKDAMVRQGRVTRACTSRSVSRAVTEMDVMIIGESLTITLLRYRRIRHDE
jgi:hypothetical protein